MRFFTKKKKNHLFIHSFVRSFIENEKKTQPHKMFPHIYNDTLNAKINNNKTGNKVERK